MTRKTTKTEALAACEGSAGIANQAAMRLGVNRITFWRLRQRWPEVAEALESERQKTLDFAETRILQLMRSDNPRVAVDAVKFYLERMGRDRGWGQQQQVSVSAEKPVQPIICFEPTDAPAGGQDGGE